MLFYEGDRLKDRILKELERKYKLVRKSRNKILVDRLEKEIISTFEYSSDYVDAGGLTKFAAGIEQLVAEGFLTPLAISKQYKTTRLNSAYWLCETASSLTSWSEVDMLRVLDSRLLKLDYYKNHPEEQSELIWSYVERVYNFLRTANDRMYVTREERSLELFDQEKWLSEDEGNQFLSRIGVTLDSLKAIIVRELFESYIQTQGLVRYILISENHSFYDSAKRLVQQGKPVCGITPDMLIYGEGWKIVSSLLYLQELKVDTSQAEILYVGDMDKTGWDIYGNLKLKYAGLNLHLALPVYIQMIGHARNSYTYPKEQQPCPPLHLEIVTQEFAKEPELLACLMQLLAENRRIPQEVLNYEVMARLEEA